MGKRSFCAKRLVGGSYVGAIDHLNMIAFVLGHQRIARNAVEYGVHDRPFGSRCLPAALGFLAREFDGATSADIHVQFIVLDVDSRPNDFARLRYASKCAATVREIHGRLPKALSACPSVDEMSGGSGATDKKNPHV